MRTLFKNYTLSIFMVFVIVITNCFVYYTLVCNSNILQIKDIYGKVSSVTLSSVHHRKNLIMNLSDNNKEDIEQMLKEIALLKDYSTAVDYVQNNDKSAILKWEELSFDERKTYAETLYQECKDKYSSKTGQLSNLIEEDISDLEKTISYLRYLNDYHDYIRNIETNSEFLLDISIYQNDNKIIDNIIKTRKDFYGLSGIILTPVIEDGYITFLNFRITDFFAVLIALLSLTTIKSEKIHRQKILLTPILITIISTLIMYLGNFILTDRFIGMPQMTVAIQSMESFKSCPYVINAGFLAISTTVAKTLGCFIVLLVSILILSVKGKKKAFVLFFVSIIIFAEIFFAINNFSDVLKEINLLSLFSFERFFIRYMNIKIFGITISRLPVFVVFVLIVFIFITIISVQSVSKRIEELTRESEQAYYDEINRRYLESRKIHHDINNHLLAINTLIETGNLEQAKRYIFEVSEQLDLVTMPIKTGRDVLDALLFKKTEQATKKGANIVFEINSSLHNCSISDYDLCTIFGNILDNAIEAVNSGDRISVSIEKQYNMFYIFCENAFHKELKRKGERILSTKKDFGSHGFGLTRIKDIAKHYGGDVNITAVNRVFRIEILINLP